VNIFTAIYLFLVFKNQSVIHTLLLTSDQERLLIVYIIIAFFLKLLHLIHELLVIGTIDIFFIDWERPKKRDLNSSVTITRPKSGSTVNDNNENVDINKPNSGSRSSISGSLIPPSAKSAQLKPFIEFPNVTVWRSNFVANEWMELCGRRRLSLSFHVLLVILTLDVSISFVTFEY
jgi:meckelin